MGETMEYKTIVEEKLRELFDDFGKSLKQFKIELSKIPDQIPELPDLESISEQIASSIPEPEPVIQKEEPTEKIILKPQINNRLLYFIEKLEFASNQSEVLKNLMEFIKEYSERGFLCIIKDSTAKVWNHFGFDGSVAGKSFDINRDPLLRSLMANRSRLILDKSLPDFIPVKEEVKRCLIAPLLLKGKAVALIYADSGEKGKLDHYSIDILIKSASLVLDLLPLRQKRDPLPPTLEEIDIVIEGEEEEQAKSQEELFVESQDMNVRREEEFEESPIERTAPSRPPELEEIEREGFASPPPYSAVEEVEEPPQEAEREFEEVPAVEVPPVKEVVEEEPVPPEEQKEHEGAKRFAKLLVQEILLYHPEEVEKGRQNKNLMALLRDDIEKSREAYEQRYQKPSIKKRDYFRKALIQYICEGDETLLGD